MIRGTTLLPLALGGLIAAVSFFVFPPLLGLVSCVLGWTMLAIAVADARRFIVPDVLSVPAIPIGLLAAPLLDASRAPSSLMLEHTGAMLLGAGALYTIRQGYERLRGREGLGLGDVKLAAVAGAWTGLAGLGHVLLLACLLALSAVLLAHAGRLGTLRGSTAIALGVFLAPSIWLVWCLGALGIDPINALLAGLAY
jgi:leader peptidase (prepilin peptidase) / N-methyltransferase